MTNEQLKTLKKSLNALEKILKNPSTLEKKGITPEEICSENHVSIGILVYYFWHMYDVNMDLLKAALTSAKINDDLFQAIFEIVSAKWLKKANTNVEKTIAEIENMTN